MQIAAVPRYPQLLTDDQNNSSAEFHIPSSDIKENPCSSGDDDDAQQVVSKPKRSLRFYEVVSIRPTIHLDDMTDDEIDNSWYTHREMTYIKRRLAADVKYWVSGKPMNETLHTSRGLEFRTREGSQKRKANKINAIEDVLDEQDLQKLQGIDNPEAIRSVYYPHALRCLQAAQVLAMGDELECKIMRKMDLAIARARQQKARVAAEIKMEPNKRGNMFKRLFANKAEVMQEIKDLNIDEEQ